MEITTDLIKELRELTSCGVIECKKALEESAGDLQKAKAYLQKRGLEIEKKKGSRTAKEGRIESYLHSGNKIGVMLELNCETDFVAKNEDFVRISKDIAMHIAAMNPKYVRREDIPEDVLKEQKDVNVFAKEVCLMEQPFVKEPGKTITDIINGIIASVGENIQVGRFIRYKVNESE